MHWKPTGTVYPENMNSARPRDMTLDDWRGKPSITKIPTCPNKFAPLAEGTSADPIVTEEDSTAVHQSLVNDILAAVLPRILAALPGNAPLDQSSPYVNADRRHRSRSRDPRIQREKAQSESNNEVAVPEVDRGIVVMTEVVETMVSVEQQTQCVSSDKEGTGGKKKNKRYLKVTTNDDVLEPLVVTGEWTEVQDDEAVGPQKESVAAEAHPTDTGT